ncbi:LCP family protein [Roseburia hominis]
MDQKKKRRSDQRRSSDVNENRNVRNINNSREVSRRAKGKDRYPYEEDRRSAMRRREENDFYRSDAQNRRRTRDEDMRNSRKNSVNDNKHRNVRRRGRRKNGFSKTLGIMLAIVQFVLSVVLVVNVLFFGMLTDTYVLILAGVLLILLGITLLTQIGAKGKGIGGKIFCLFLCVVLGTGSFYISKINNAFQDILSSTKKTSSMVVAVRSSDTAERIEDTRMYQFGVQYTTGSDQMKSAVHQVEKELGKEIETVEYSSLVEEAKALLGGEVDAIIYNSGQAGVVNDQIPSFEDEIKVIYTHNIVVEIANEAADASVEEPFAVYLSGIDVYGDITQESRSDVNIIAVVNPKSHQVLLVTTPRDFYVPIPGISNGQNDKLTHAGLYGVDVSMATLEEVYDLDIKFFGRVNFTSMISIVDALGGLDVESDAEFETGTESGEVVYVNEGMNHFNGKQALAFCRERHALPDGDNARGRHQQAVITAIIKKMMSPSMLRGAADIIDSVSSGVDTNFSMSQVQALIKTQLRTNAQWNIYSVAAEGIGAKDICYSSGDTLLYVTIPDETSVANIKDLIDRVIAGEVLEDSTTTE